MKSLYLLIVPGRNGSNYMLLPPRFLQKPNVRTMSSRESIALAKAHFDAINNRLKDRFIKIKTSDYWAEEPGNEEPMNAEQQWEYISGFIKAFPDLKFNLEQMVSEHTGVSVVWSATGTHDGPLSLPRNAPIAPTGRSVTVRGISFFKVKDWMLAGEIAVYDTHSLVIQLGL